MQLYFVKKQSTTSHFKTQALTNLAAEKRRNMFSTLNHNDKDCVYTIRELDVIRACGHENIRALNKNTFEITKVTELTQRGDCIIAVGANKGVKDLRSELKRILGQDGAKLTVIIQVDEKEEVIEAWGSPKLTFSHPTDMVIRKSSYICGRTLAIKADKAAEDFSRQLVSSLRNPGQKVNVTLTAEKIGQ